MKGMTREEIKQAFRETVSKYGNPVSGDVYCEHQLIEKIAHDLCAYDETHITFEFGRFDVSPSLCIKAEYAPDHTFIGTVKAREWYSPEQLKAMHEIAFGYQF